MESPETDEYIAKQVQAGKTEAFGLLVERYEEKLRRYARRFLFGYTDSKDVVQEVFLKAYTNIQSFNIARSFSSWIYRIAHNEFINAIKKKGKEPLPFFDSDTLFPHPIAPTQADSELQKKELLEILNNSLEHLDPKYREPLVLYYYEEMDYQQIADVLQIPVSTVGVRILRAKNKLQNMHAH